MRPTLRFLRTVARNPVLLGVSAMALLGFVMVIEVFGWRTRLAYGASMLSLLALAVVIERLPSEGMFSGSGHKSVMAIAGFALAVCSYVGYRTYLLSDQSSLAWQFLVAAALAGFTMLRFAVGIHAASKHTGTETQIAGGTTPSVSICVPCYNEGRQIADTLASMVFDYPADRYEVIVVDDGSTDDSRLHIDEGLKVLGAHGVRARQLAPQDNAGKRHVMARAIRESDSEIVVLVDSDSTLESDALTKLANYFEDPSIGGVSAHADVLNADQSLVSKMQVARYYIAFRITKAGESLFGAVGCLSGCCSAYRRAALVDGLEGWLNQRFLGTKCTYSDDRALTNMLLRDGYRTVYAPDVMSYTVVPHTLGKFLRQQMRWKRGWLINSIDAATFMWRLHPVAAFFFYGNLAFAFVSTFLVIRSVHFGLATAGVQQLAQAAGAVALATVSFGCVYSLFRRDFYWVYGLAWSALYLTVMVLQLPFAILTIRETKWGTR